MARYMGRKLGRDFRPERSYCRYSNFNTTSEQWHCRRYWGFRYVNGPSESFTPTPYPTLELAWPISWAVVGLFLLFAFPFAGSIYLLITIPIGLFFCARFLIDLIAAWADHKWGRE